MRSTAATLTLLALWGGLGGCSPLSIRGPERRIEETLLRGTPLSATAPQVREWLATSHIKWREGVFSAEAPGYPLESDLGATFFEASLGHYGVFMRTDVVAFYVFDANGVLVQVAVKKQRDAP